MTAEPHPTALPATPAATPNATTGAEDLDHLPLALRHGADMGRLADRRLLRALDWWRGLAAQSAFPLPDRLQIEPAAITDLLPYCILWDVLPQQGETRLYRCRLAGTILCEIYGRDGRGLMLHEMFGDDTARMQAELDVAVAHARPFHAEHRMTWAKKDFYKYRRILLPFTHRAAALRQAGGLGGDPRVDDPAYDSGRVGLLMNVISFVPE
ncbi:PAS domain-containing protein [Ferrovibrio sp.]|uniref:PAS domain-containing protein n=1 Tax=Ferrovibrio sp. TaxID=1917215 RepID=UPI002602132C|nr:PAS domain-containing protein [Ferrovibrio sp.]